MSQSSWEAEVDSMISGDAADAMARGKKGKGKASTGDNLFQGLFSVLGIGNKPITAKSGKATMPSLTNPKVSLLDAEGKPNTAETPDFEAAPGGGIPSDGFGLPDLGKVAKKTDILSLALKAIGLGF